VRHGGREKVKPVVDVRCVGDDTVYASRVESKTDSCGFGLGTVIAFDENAGT
jgi:hypothetical protein